MTPPSSFRVLALLVPLLGAWDCTTAKTIMFTGEDGFPRIYQVEYSPSGRYYARGEPTLIPAYFGGPRIEVFKTSRSPDPKTADNPEWSANVPNWSDFEIGNSGRTLTVVHITPVIVSSKRPKVPAIRARGRGVTTVQARADGKKRKRSFKISSLSRYLEFLLDGVIEGDVVYPSDDRSTYGWYRRHRVQGNRFRLYAYGKRTSFHLDTGRKL